MNKPTNQTAKAILKTANGKYMSEMFYFTGKDFETQHLSDAKVFDSLEEANEYIIECKFDNTFVCAENLQNESTEPPRDDTKHSKLIQTLRNVSKDPYFQDKSVSIPEGCEYIKEGEYLIKDLLHFIADMME